MVLLLIKDCSLSLVSLFLTVLTKYWQRRFMAEYLKTAHGGRMSSFFVSEVFIS